LSEKIQIFCEHELKLDDKVEMYDLLSKKFEVFLDTNVDGNIVCLVWQSLWSTMVWTSAITYI